MPIGYHGESCGEAIRQLIGSAETMRASRIIEQVRAKGPWKDETIWQHLMALVVNLPPARYHWKTTKPFLFLRPDGQYELYDEAKHPTVIE
jgi:hypothetical protein